MTTDTMRIGEVATEAGVNIQTLRYYERRGLLKQPERTPAGHREFPAETVRLVRFIKRAQDLGFTLAEIEELLRLREDQSASCGKVRATARAKIEEIERKVASLRAMKRALVVLENTCTSKGSTRECPILEALDDPSPKKQRP